MNDTTPPTVYAPPLFAAGIDIDLSRNEGRAPRGGSWPEVVEPAALAKYPDLHELHEVLAKHHGVATERLLLTAGADDGLLRVCLASLREGAEALVATPTFEMIERYVAMARGTVRAVAWPEGPFPIEAMLAAASARTTVAFVVSPNNPTGAVASAHDLVRLARALPQVLVVLDAAYAEFASEDLTATALQHDNVVVLRTLSKAWGLAGLRVGHALGSASTIARLAACGNPMPVSVASARYALRRLANGHADLADHVAQVRLERAELAPLLQRLGARPAEPAEGNFVLARGLDARWTSEAAAALGIALRRFPERPDLADAVRIGLPGDAAVFARLLETLQAVLAPEALLFDLDGVLADVSTSYRGAIVATAASYDVTLLPADIEAAKESGNANCDWQLTRSLLAQRGIVRPLAEITDRFEGIYLRLRDGERLLVDRQTLQQWRRRHRLAIVTGRPLRDARYFLERFGVGDCFDVVVAREHAANKPDPAPVRVAMAQLAVRSAWMLGDTVDDVVAARGAGAVPIGVVAPGSDLERAISTLRHAGAARVLPRTLELNELLR